jgi:hypothetical protein
MNIKEYNDFYHVDISMQIDNKWKEDTVLGIVKNSRKFSIRIRGRDKEIIKKKYIFDNDSDSNKKHNKKVVAIVYSYLLYKALCNFLEAKPLLLCRDVRPERFVINYLQKICHFFNNHEVFNRIIKFRKRIEFESEKKLPDSLAGKYARKVYQNKLSASKIIDKKELEELIEIIGKIL